MKKRGYRNSPRSEKVKKKISVGLKKYFKKHSPAWKGKHFSRRKKQELSKIKLEFLRKNPSWREKKSKAMKEFCKKNPWFMKQVQKLSLKHFSKHPEVISRRNNSIRKAYKNPALKKKISIAVRKTYQKNPEIARLIDRKVTEWWREHPNIRRERSIEMKRFFLENPEEFKKKLMNTKSNPFRQHIKTRQGFRVRSLGEKKIADFLFSKGIECSYESEMLILDGWVCVPDFYLVDYDVYIEYYGGYPGSRQKKVWKNKLYKKYDVNCVFITPSELGNLDKFLIGELRKMFGKVF